MNSPRGSLHRAVPLADTWAELMMAVAWRDRPGLCAVVVTNLAWGEVSVRLSLPGGSDSRKASNTVHCCKPLISIFKGAPFSDVFAAQAPQPRPFGAAHCLGGTWQGAFHPVLWLQVLQRCRW